MREHDPSTSTTSGSGAGTEKIATAKTRVAIVEDQRLIAEALTFALRGQGLGVSQLELAETEVLLDRLVASRPDLVLLDLDLGGFGEGTALIAPLRKEGIDVLVVTGVADVERVAAAIECGALGVVSKNGPFHGLVEKIVAAAKGQPVIHPADRRRMLDEARRRRSRRTATLAPFERLTPREGEILRELSCGSSVAAIARTAVVSEATVRTQVRSILTKLDVHSQLEAVVAARRSGWA